MNRSLISSETISAYKATNYRVFSPVPFVLKIGQSSDPLRRLYSEHNCASSTFITAYNPYSIETSDPENVEAQSRLEHRLQERSFPIIAGIGEDSAGMWPGEPSILILGITRDEAKSFGVEFGQNAIVWAQEDAIPRLILLV
jgi:hypothetical protein